MKITENKEHLKNLGWSDELINAFDAASNAINCDTTSVEFASCVIEIENSSVENSLKCEFVGDDASSSVFVRH